MQDRKKSIIDSEQISTSRLETLTDGIFAIAMTLLVLEIHVPELLEVTSSGELFNQVGHLWSIIGSFIVSFLVLGMFWVSHHIEFHYIKKLDNKLIWLNMCYLLFVSFIPFSAALLGRYPHNQFAVVLYALHLIAMVGVQYSMWQHASHNSSLLSENVDPRLNSLVNKIGFLAISGYLVAIVFSFWSIEAALVMYALIPLPYIFGWIYKL